MEEAGVEARKGEVALPRSVLEVAGELGLHTGKPL